MGFRKDSPARVEARQSRSERRTAKKRMGVRGQGRSVMRGGAGVERVTEGQRYEEATPFSKCGEAHPPRRELRFGSTRRSARSFRFRMPHEEKPPTHPSSPSRPASQGAVNFAPVRWVFQHPCYHHPKSPGGRSGVRREAPAVEELLWSAPARRSARSLRSQPHRCHPYARTPLSTMHQSRPKNHPMALPHPYSLQNPTKCHGYGFSL